MTTAVIVLACYAFAATVFLVLSIRRRAEEATIMPEVRRLASLEFQATERLKALAEVAKVKREELPWFERSLSAVGIVAFFSMSIAAGFQTLRVQTEAAKLEQLRADTKLLEDQRRDVEYLANDVIEFMFSTQLPAGRMDDVSRRVLGRYLETLERRGIRTRREFTQAYQIAYALGQIGRVIVLVERHSDFVKSPDPDAAVTLAEYYYLTRAEERAKTILRTVVEQSVIGAGLHLRIAVLRRLVGEATAEDARRVGGLLRVPTEEAERRILTESEKLRTARNATK
jgi:hypothetical protein